MQIFLRAGFVLFTGFCFTFVEAAGQTANSQALTPGAPIAREPSGRQPHSYEIVLEAGQFTIVTVKQQHAPANVSLRDPFGRKIFELYRREGGDLRGGDGPIPRPGRGPCRGLRDPRRATAIGTCTGQSSRSRRTNTQRRKAAGVTSQQVVDCRKRSRSSRWRARCFGTLNTLLVRASLWCGLVTLTCSSRIERSRHAITSMRRSRSRARSTIGGSRRRRFCLWAFPIPTWWTNREPWSTSSRLSRCSKPSTIGVDRPSRSPLFNLRGSTWDEYQKALEYAERALALANAVDDRAQAARIHNYLGITYQKLGDLPKALESHNQAIPLSRAGGALRIEFMAIYNTGIVYKELGDYRRALDTYNQSLARVRKLGNVFREAQVLNDIGNVHRVGGRKPEVSRLLQPGACHLPSSQDARR